MDKPRRREKLLGLFSGGRDRRARPITPEVAADINEPASSSDLASREPGQREAVTSPKATADSGAKQRTDYASGHAPQRSLGSRDKGLWERAFDSLQNDQEIHKLLEAYERLLIEPDPGGEDNASTLKSTGTAAEASLDHVKWMDVLSSRAESTRQSMSERSTNHQAVSKVVELVGNAKDALAFVASTEPHAAIVWTGVSLLLPLVTSVIESSRDAILGLEYVAQLLTRYRLHEQTYHATTPNPATLEPQTISEVRAQFEKHTVELYARVLEYQLRMACHYARNRLQRYLRNVALGDDWKAILTSIKEYEQSSRYDMEALDSSRLNALISEKDTALVQTIMSSLYSNYESGKDSYPRGVPGTCDWFTKTGRYEKWAAATASSPFLFLTASPGCGKSVLMRYLVDETFPNSTGSCCYYFFRSSGAGGDTLATALSAMVHQICSRQTHLIMDHVKEYWNRHGVKLVTVVHLLWKIILQISEHLSSQLVCVVDGLDESSDKDRIEFMTLVNQYYSDLRSATKMKLIVSARPYFDKVFRFHTLTQGLTGVEFDLDTCQLVAEVELIIRFEVGRLQLADQVKDHLVHLMVDKQSKSRTFLWLKLLFDDLRHDLRYYDANIPTIEGAVKSAPDDLDAQYEKLLSRSPDHQAARLLLHLILGASQHQESSTITLKRLQIAFLYAETEADASTPVEVFMQSDAAFRKRIRALCGLLVTTVGDEVYIFHETATSFLEHPPGAPWSKLHWKHSFRRGDSQRLWQDVSTRYFRKMHPFRDHENIRRPAVFDAFFGAKWLESYRSLSGPSRGRTPMEENVEFLEKVIPPSDYLPLLETTDKHFWAWMMPFLRRGGYGASLAPTSVSWAFKTLSDDYDLELSEEIVDLLQLPREEGNVCSESNQRRSDDRFCITCSSPTTFKILLAELLFPDKLRKQVDEELAEFFYAWVAPRWRQIAEWRRREPRSRDLDREWEAIGANLDLNDAGAYIWRGLRQASPLSLGDAQIITYNSFLKSVESRLAPAEGSTDGSIV